MAKLIKILSTGAVAGLILTGQVAQLTTVFAEDFTENIQQTWERKIVCLMQLCFMESYLTKISRQLLH